MQPEMEITRARGFRVLLVSQRQSDCRKGGWRGLYIIVE